MDIKKSIKYLKYIIKLLELLQDYIKKYGDIELINKKFPKR